MERETERQIFHIMVGVGALAALLMLGRGFLIAATFLTLIVGTLIMNARLLGASIPLIGWFEERFERRDVPLPGWGSACYAAGALVAAVFLQETVQIASVLFILGIGDGFSTLVGMRGSHRLPYSGKKTFEGMGAMFLSSLAAWWVLGPLALPLAVVAALAESVPGIDDNLSIPIACTAFLLVFA